MFPESKWQDAQSESKAKQTPKNRRGYGPALREALWRVGPLRRLWCPGLVADFRAAHRRSPEGQ